MHATAALDRRGRIVFASANHQPAQPRGTRSVLRHIKASAGADLDIGERDQSRVGRFVASLAAQRQAAQVRTGRDREGAGRERRQAGAVQLAHLHAQQDARVAHPLGLHQAGTGTGSGAGAWPQHQQFVVGFLVRLAEQGAQGGSESARAAEQSHHAAAHPKELDQRHSEQQHARKQHAEQQQREHAQHAALLVLRGAHAQQGRLQEHERQVQAEQRPPDCGQSATLYRRLRVQ